MGSGQPWRGLLCSWLREDFLDVKRVLVEMVGSGETRGKDCNLRVRSGEFISRCLVLVWSDNVVLFKQVSPLRTNHVEIPLVPILPLWIFGNLLPVLLSDRGAIGAPSMAIHETFTENDPSTKRKRAKHAALSQNHQSLHETTLITQHHNIARNGRKMLPHQPPQCLESFLREGWIISITVFGLTSRNKTGQTV